MSRDEHILQAAEALFYERGFDAVGVDDIGERAGITGPAIYRHFNGKAEILAVLFDRGLDELAAATAGGPDGDPRAALDHLIRGYVQYVVEHQRLASIRAREDRSLTEPYRGTHERRERQHLERWIQTLGRVYPDRSPEELAANTWAVTTMLASAGRWPRRVRRRDDLVELLTRMAAGALDA